MCLSRKESPVQPNRNAAQRRNPPLPLNAAASVGIDSTQESGRRLPDILGLALTGLRQWDRLLYTTSFIAEVLAAGAARMPEWVPSCHIYFYGTQILERGRDVHCGRFDGR